VALATNYHNITHPSLPNYLAATSGTRLDIGDCGPDACPTTSESLFGQLRAAKEWRAYQESMPANCAHRDSGAYAARHNRPVYYTRIAADCARWDVPVGDDSGSLARDLRGDRLPAFALITPNLCNDTHDCPVGAGPSGHHPGPTHRLARRRPGKRLLRRTRTRDGGPRGSLRRRGSPSRLPQHLFR
jgi:phosphatidylinositol-3-phosphatase